MVDLRRSVHLPRDFPNIVVLCGSTRFSDMFRNANMQLTARGHIVLSIGCDLKGDAELFAGLTDEQLSQLKVRLDHLHKRKIDLADSVLVLNAGGYIGESTQSEIDYATNIGKPIDYWEDDDGT